MTLPNINTSINNDNKNNSTNVIENEVDTDIGRVQSGYNSQNSSPRESRRSRVTRLDVGLSHNPYANSTIGSSRKSPSRRLIKDIFIKKTINKDNTNKNAACTPSNVYSNPFINTPDRSVDNSSSIIEEEDINVVKGNDSIHMLALKVLGAIGVVYGDLITSPIYTASSVYSRFLNESRLPTDKEIIGSVSNMIWILTIIVCIKYCYFVMYADYNGEGGTFSIFEQMKQYRHKVTPSSFQFLTFLVGAAAALLLGDCVITPAISVLSSLEGITLIKPDFSGYIVGLSIAILIILYAMQCYGTKFMGHLFGPILLSWSIIMIYTGIYNIEKDRRIALALNPLEMIMYWISGRGRFIDLSNIILCATGTEAMFADMGHFGRKPILIAWWAILYPSVLLQYLGQGSYLLWLNKTFHSMTNNEKLKIFKNLENSVFWTTIPRSSSVVYYLVLVLATLATIAASQSVITSAFTLMSQASNLHFLPHLKVVYTNPKEKGQIYIAFVAVTHCIAAIALVAVYKHSARLAAAFGAAVTSVFVITTILIFLYISSFVWKYPKYKSYILFVLFMLMDTPIWLSTIQKFPDGAWFPFTVGIVIMGIMYTWIIVTNWRHDTVRKLSEKDGEILKHKLKDINKFEGLGIFFTRTNVTSIPDDIFSGNDDTNKKLNVRTPSDHYGPFSLARFACKLHIIPRYILLITIQTATEPFISENERISIEILNETNNIDDGIVCAVNVYFGWAEPPNSLNLLYCLHNLAIQRNNFFPLPIQKRLCNIYRNDLDEDDTEKLIKLSDVPKEEIDVIQSTIICLNNGDNNDVSLKEKSNNNTIIKEPLCIFTSRKYIKSSKSSPIYKKCLIWVYNLIKQLLETPPTGQFHLPPENTTEIGISLTI